MLRTEAKELIDEYEQDLDEVVAACDGDMQPAVTALLLLDKSANALWLLSAKLADRRFYRLQLLHYVISHLFQFPRGSPFGRHADR